MRDTSVVGYCTVPRYTLACTMLYDRSVNTVLIQSCPFHTGLTHLQVSHQCVCGQMGYKSDLSWQQLLELFCCQHLSLVQHHYTAVACPRVCVSEQILGELSLVKFCTSLKLTGMKIKPSLKNISVDKLP